MPQSFEKNKIIRERRKKELRSAALHLFATLGFENVRVDDIVKLANCSHGLFYSYYRNQKEIFLAAERDILTRNDGSYFIPFKELSKTKTGKEFDEIVERFIRISEAEEDVVDYYATLALDDFNVQFVPSRFYDKTDKLLFCQIVHEAIDAGILRDGQTDELVNLIFDCAAGRLLRRIRMQGARISLQTYSRLL